MSKLDVRNNISVVTSLAAAARSSNIEVDGSAVHLNGYHGSAVMFQSFAYTDGTHTPKVQESNTTTSGDFTDVAAADLNGTLAAITTANNTQIVGYRGTKPYIRGVITTSNVSSSGAITSCQVILGYPAEPPVPGGYQKSYIS